MNSLVLFELIKENEKEKQVQYFFDHIYFCSFVCSWKCAMMPVTEQRKRRNNLNELSRVTSIPIFSSPLKKWKKETEWANHLNKIKYLVLLFDMAPFFLFSLWVSTFCMDAIFMINLGEGAKCLDFSSHKYKNIRFDTVTA